VNETVSLTYCIHLQKILLKMPIAMPGDIKLLGGEFILGPGLQCTFTHRMTTVRGHLDIERILKIAGCDLTLKSPTSVMEEGSVSGRSASRQQADHAEFYDARESMDDAHHPGRAESTKSLGRKNKRFTKIFGRRKSKGGEDDDDYVSGGEGIRSSSRQEVADGRRSAQSFNMAKAKKERMSWNPFSFSSSKTKETPAPLPPMPANAVAVISAANSRRPSEQYFEAQEEVETLEAAQRAKAQSPSVEPSSRSVVSPLPGHASPANRAGMQSQNASSPEPNSFKELRAAALRPMPKQRLGVPFSPEPESPSQFNGHHRGSTEERRRQSPEDEEARRSKTPTDARSEYSPAQERSREGRLPLSDISRTTSMYMEDSRRSEDVNSEAGPGSSYSTEADVSPHASLRMRQYGPQSPSTSLFDDNSSDGRYASRSSMQESDRFDSARRVKDKDLPTTPSGRLNIPAAAAAPVMGGSFLDSLDVVDGFIRREPAAEVPARDNFYFDGSDEDKRDESVEESVNDDSDTDAPGNGLRGSGDDTMEEPSEDEEEMEQEGEEGTVTGHRTVGESAQGTLRKPDIHVDDSGVRRIDEEDEEEDSDEDFGDDDHQSGLLGGGLSLSSMRPTLSPTPEDEEEEEEDDEDFDEEDRVTGGGSSSSYNSFGSQFGSAARSQFKSGTLVRAPSGNLGTFIEEEEEDDAIDEDGGEKEQHQQQQQRQLMI
jgi:hypothetical protein